MATGLTSKGAATRRRIVESAADLVRDQGVDQVSLDDIRAATATSKSQLFHYFPDGRSDLLLAVAEHEAQQVIEDQQPFLGELGSPESWTAWRDAVVAKYEKQGSRCPLNALTRQLAPTYPGVAPLVARLLSDWHASIAAGIRRSEGAAVDLDPERTAAVILAAIQGGVVLLMATGDSSFLRTALDTALEPVIDPS